MKDSIIPNGTKVVIKDINLKATTLSVCMFGEGNTTIEYRIIYWKGGERVDAWVFDWEIELFIDTSKKMGMVNYESDTTKLIK